MTATQLRRLAIQAFALLAVGALLFAAFSNARANLAARGIPTSFDFLNHVAGFGLNQSFIPYSPLSSYGRALLVGLANTIVVSILAGVFATLIGFAAGFARLSRNWALSRLATLYVETIRNIPLLLQMLFWYVAILSPLPGPEASLTLPGVLLNNRGLSLPGPTFAPGALWVFVAALAGAALAWALRRRAAPAPVAALALLTPPLIAFFAGGRPIGLDLPAFDPGVNIYNVEGGLRLPPEIFSLVLALSLYTGSYIAEIVRAGVQSVARGQSEAAAALGLNAGRARKLVIVPQAMRIIMPPLISQYLALVKNSSLAAFVGFADLMQVSGTILNQTGAAVQVISLDMAIYLSISLITLLVIQLYERRLRWGGGAMTQDYVRAAFAPAAPPPPLRRDFIASLRENLFGDARSTAITLAVGALLIFVLPPLWRFLIVDAVWRAPDGAMCRAPGAGACWAYIAAKTPFFVYGSYPPEFYWRVNVAFGLAAGLIVWLLWPDARGKRVAALGFFVLLPVIGFILLHGAPALGLPIVGTHLWGGVMVSLLVALVGIVVALPGGVLLALGRRSDLPAVKMLCVGLIEFVRGVPLIAVLFMANTMLPLFLPPAWAPDRLLRPLAGIALFASAYMAEVVRAGLLTVPKGQTEGAQALGLGRVATLRLVVLPQALAAVIPGIVNNFIALFKDTTLVAIVGVFDFLRAVDTARLDPVWAGPNIATTGYVFAALFYLVFCLAMSRYSQSVEKRLDSGRSR